MGNIPDGGVLFQDIPDMNLGVMMDDMFDDEPEELDENEAVSVDDEISQVDDFCGTRSWMSLYLQKISEAPLLTAEDEIRLGNMVHHGMPEEQKFAWNELVSRNLRYVVKIAKRYLSSGLSLEDLIQEGNIGLMKAAEKYDPDTGNRFITYATWWIRQSITRAISDKGRLIRLPVHITEKIRKLRQRQAAYEKDGKMPDMKTIAADLQMDEKQIEQLLAASVDTVSLDIPVGEESDMTLGDFIPDTALYSPEDTAMHNDLLESLEQAMSCLSQKEKDVLADRFGLYGRQAKTLEEIGSVMGVTRERIRQIEEKALWKLRNPKRSANLRNYLRP